jgi:heme exporter protein B
MRVAWAILRRELRGELRAREILPTILVFATLIVVLMNFAFEPSREESALLGPGVLWVAIAFSGILGLSRSAALDGENAALDGLLAAPVDRGSLYVGKVLANLVFVLASEVVLVPLFLVLYDAAALGTLLALAPTILLGTIGYVAVGTIFAAVAVCSRLREILLPILLLPVAIPLLLAAVEATSIVLAGEGTRHLGSWNRILVVFDVVYLVASYLLFEYVLEDSQ